MQPRSQERTRPSLGPEPRAQGASQRARWGGGAALAPVSVLSCHWRCFPLGRWVPDSGAGAEGLTGPSCVPYEEGGP